MASPSAPVHPSRYLAVFLVLLIGVYLASHAHVWSKVWVTVPLVILLALLATGGMFFGPLERRMGEIAQRDVGEGGGSLSAEYMALHQRWMTAGEGDSILRSLSSELRRPAWE